MTQRFACMIPDGWSGATNALEGIPLTVGAVRERDQDQDADDGLQQEIEIGRPGDDPCKLHESATLGSRWAGLSSASSNSYAGEGLVCLLSS